MTPVPPGRGGRRPRTRRPGATSVGGGGCRSGREPAGRRREGRRNGPRRITARQDRGARRRRPPTTMTRSRGQSAQRPDESRPSRCRQAAFNAAAFPVLASGGVRVSTVISGSVLRASTSAVPSDEPSSMTMIALFVASTANRRSTLSPIVTSSFNAGTRNTQRKESAAAGSGPGAVRFHRREDTKRIPVHASTPTMSAQTK